MLNLRSDNRLTRSILYTVHTQTLASLIRGNYLFSKTSQQQEQTHTHKKKHLSPEG